MKKTTRGSSTLPGCPGFTLIELSVVLVVVGIIISIIATALPSLIQTSKIKQTRATLEKIDISIEGYIYANGRCPCPDTDGDGNENRVIGSSSPSDDTCPSYAGDLPYLTLGLSSSKDAWQNPVRYAVYEDIIRTTISGLCAQSPCTSCLRDFALNPDATALHTTTGTASSTQAYLIISGGIRDVDGSNGYFDGRNAILTDMDFESTDKIMDATYDDMVRTVSLTYLLGKLCSGSTGGGAGGGTENTAANGCTNGTDDDGDGSIDCADSDCSSDPACSSTPSVTITTTTIPTGVVESSYSTTVQASGGTNPYEWTILNNGGFSDFSLNTYSGLLSGTLNQCPGTYSLSVRVEDETPAGDGGPDTDSRTLSLEVTSDLAISRTSGSGTAIDWTSIYQQETFTAPGGRLGTINWTLDSGGASGFTVSSQGDASCAIGKTGNTSTGSYTFILSAVDADCPANSSSLTLAVNVTGSGSGTPGNIGSSIDTLEYDTSNGEEPSLVHVSGAIYAVAYRGSSSDGYVRTLRIDSDGSIGSNYIDSFQFDSNSCYSPELIHISDSVFAVAYNQNTSDGIVRTFTIDTSGNISNSQIDSLIFENQYSEYNDVIHISDDLYAVAYAGRTSSNEDNGWFATFRISSTGLLSSNVIDALEYDTSDGTFPDIIKISDGVIAIAFTGPNSDGYLKTLNIANDGQIFDTTIDTLELDPSNGSEPAIVNVSSDIYAIAYTGPDSDGHLATVQIDTSGQITNTVIDTLEFDTSSGYESDLIHIAGNIFAIAYRSNKGNLITIDISDDGEISDTVIDTFTYDNSDGAYPDLVRIASDMIAVAYSGASSDGFITTVSLE